MPGQSLKDLLLQIFRFKAFTVFTHLLCWLLFFSLPLLFLGPSAGNEKVRVVIAMPEYWLFYGCYILLFYVHAYVLLPYLFFRRKYFSYLGCILILFIAIFFLKPFDSFISKVSSNPEINRSSEPFPFGNQLQTINNDFSNNQPPIGHPVEFDSVSIFLFIIVGALSMAGELTRQSRTSQQRALQAEADKANAELSFLKAQINPHFLFNILNNIYSLAVIKHDNTADAILKLSNIMRYVTDEAGADFVILKNEAACIKDYIDLQQLRLSKKVQLAFSIDGNLENKKIAPLVLITFIENVFKYGISNREETKIIINLKAEKDKIIFYCQNPIVLHHTSLEREGFGLANTKVRLQHLYPDNHTLTITTDNGLFTVLLTINS